MEAEEPHLLKEKCRFCILFVKIAKEKCCLAISFVDIAKEKCCLAISFVDIAKHKLRLKISFVEIVKEKCGFEIAKHKHRLEISFVEIAKYKHRLAISLVEIANTNTVWRFHLLKLQNRQTPIGDFICWNCKIKSISHEWKIAKAFGVFFSFCWVAFAELLSLSCFCFCFRCVAFAFVFAFAFAYVELLYSRRGSNSSQILILGRMATANGTYVFIVVELLRKLISNSELTFFYITIRFAEGNEHVCYAHVSFTS